MSIIILFRIYVKKPLFVIEMYFKIDESGNLITPNQNIIPFINNDKFKKIKSRYVKTEADVYFS